MLEKNLIFKGKCLFLFSFTLFLIFLTIPSLINETVRSVSLFVVAGPAFVGLCLILRAQYRRYLFKQRGKRWSSMSVEERYQDTANKIKSGKKRWYLLNPDDEGDGGPVFVLALGKSVKGTLGGRVPKPISSNDVRQFVKDNRIGNVEHVQSILSCL